MVTIRGNKVELEDGDVIVFGDDEDFELGYDETGDDRLEFVDDQGNEMYLNKGQSGDLLMVGADHSLLGGLEDDDHPQYTLHEEARDISWGSTNSQQGKKYRQEVNFDATNTLLSDYVIYQRLYLREGQDISAIQSYFTASTTTDVDVGIYDETNKEPDSLLASSGVQLSYSINGSVYTDIPLSSTWTVPSTGYYWMAWLGDSGANVKATSWSVNSSIEAGGDWFHPQLAESRASTDGLPNTATASIEKSRFFYLAAVGDFTL